MKILTLIPSRDPYGMMSLALLSLGSFTIASHVHVRWLKNKFSFVASNAIVKSMIALFGLTIVNLFDLFTCHLYWELTCLFIGIFLGLITIRFEVYMIRKSNRNRLIDDRGKNKCRDENDLLRSAIVKNKMLLPSSKVIKAKGLIHVRRSHGQSADLPDFINDSLLSLMMVAIAEEFLFRGYIIFIANSMNDKMIMIVMILASIILFACSHMTDLSEFKYKLPLSIFTTLGFIVTGTLLTAITTHLILNIYAYDKLRKRNFTKIKLNYLPLGVL